MTTKKPQTIKKSSAPKSKVKMQSDDLKKSTASSEDFNVVEELRHKLKVATLNQNNLAKSVKPLTIRGDAKKIDKSKIVYSSRNYDNGYEGVDMKGYRRMSDDELREVSIVDPYISAIISTRCSQAAVIGRPSDSKFDKGSRVMDIKALDVDDFESRDEYNKAQDIRNKQSETILRWVMNCGTTDKAYLDTIFQGADTTFKRCSLADFVTSQIRNILTFGRMSTQIFRNEDNVPIAFRPAPVETIYPVVNGKPAYVGVGEDTMDQSLVDAEAYNELDHDERPAAYIQRVDGRNVNLFTEDDMKMSYLQKQALFDLRGYPMAPIEQAIYMVFIHQNTLGYLRNQFVKGLGTKGMLVIKAEDPSAELSEEDLDSIRRQFHNYLNRTDNSATTPVVSGPIDVSWIQLAATPRDMEFLQVEEHVIRALCAAFQTSPLEMGYGHLGISGGGGLNQASKQEEIVRGEERGLRMVLDVIYDHLNEILYECFDDAKNIFRLSYVGVGEDTRDAVIQRHQQELQTTATMDSLWADSEKTDSIAIGGAVPLAPLFHANVVKYMKYGVFMEEFFGCEGWSKLPEYDFIIDPALNQSYQDNRMFSPDMRREQGELQLKTAEGQVEGMEMQNSMMEQQAQMPPPGAPVQGQPAPQPGQEPAQKSLSQAFEERRALHKNSDAKFQ